MSFRPIKAYQKNLEQNNNMTFITRYYTHFKLSGVRFSLILLMVDSFYQSGVLSKEKLRHPFALLGSTFSW